MNCTNCNSENTQRLEVIFHDGTSHINTSSRTAGTSLTNPIGGLFGAKTKTKGISMSTAAQKAAPPAKKSFKASIILIIIGAFWTYMNTINHFDFISAIIGIALIAGGGYLGYRSFKYNSEVFPGLYNHWLNSWMCNKCGTIFTVE
ncbi:hypothetical protein [Francisella tularensis]|uniref:hypothetical protein n=1 Tax=Francisella tularensis TaxID=263 RepID=UPI00018553CB|nr:hypothetical protein [Francisella tularensis]EDZ89885.1 hypothetical protein FTG_0074 [Francisella tularensis subsp. novicida FTG]MBK2334827.1 hypothetical protein [Francisella tularensis subsp. novicida]